MLRWLVSLSILCRFSGVVHCVTTTNEDLPALLPTTPESTSPVSESFSEEIKTLDLGPLWLPRAFRITCCSGGRPAPEDPSVVRNWTSKLTNYYSTHIAASTNGEDNENGMSLQRSGDNDCRTYEGTYILSASALFQSHGFSSTGVMCKCRDSSTLSRLHLDRNCRRLTSCRNNGYRSFSSNRRCICPEPYFGDNCERICEQGQRMIGSDGRYYCGCIPFYQGEECRDMVCLNGGTQLKQRCLCPPGFLGYHCEIGTNQTSGVVRFQKFGEQSADVFTRDVSGTIFSFIMIIVLVISMYLLMKHRMQVQSRFISMRRSDLSRYINSSGLRRTDFISPEDGRMIAFRSAVLPDGGPPPYMCHPGRGRRFERLPPLPSYEIATKLPPLSRPIVEIAALHPQEQQHMDDSVQASTAVDDVSEASSASPMNERPMNHSEEQPSTSTPGSKSNASKFVIRELRANENKEDNEWKRRSI